MRRGAPSGDAQDREPREWGTADLETPPPSPPGEQLGEPLDDQRSVHWRDEPLTVAEVMTTGLKIVERDTKLPEVARLMRDEDVGVVPVVETDGRLVGVVTDRDIVVRACVGGRPIAELTACDVMTEDVISVVPEERIRDVLVCMGERQVRRMPVVDDDERLLGIVSIGDIANRAGYDAELEEAFERISSAKGFWDRAGR
jgi:CBS domain-containing protein